MEGKMQYLLTIRDQATGTNRWDQIAKKTNVYPFEQKVYSNKELFFDGTDCEQFFDCNFSSLLSSKKSVSSFPLDTELRSYIYWGSTICLCRWLLSVDIDVCFSVLTFVRFYQIWNIIYLLDSIVNGLSVRK